MRVIYVLCGLLLLTALGYYLNVTQFIGGLILMLGIPVLLVILILRAYRKTPYTEDVQLKLLLLIMAVLSIGMLVSTVLFKAMHWPFASVINILAAAIIVLLVITGIWYLILNRQELGKRIVIEFFIILLPALWFFSMNITMQVPIEEYHQVSKQSFKDSYKDIFYADRTNDSLRKYFVIEGDSILNTIDSITKNLDNKYERLIELNGGIEPNGVPVRAYSDRVYKTYVKQLNIDSLLRHNKHFFDEKKLKALSDSQYFITYLIQLNEIRADILLTQQDRLYKKIKNEE